jgi:hypothetical protein
VPKTGGQAEEVVSNPDVYLSFALDDTFVYWGEANAVMKQALTGGTPEVVVSGETSPVVSAVDDEHVFWIDGDRIRMAEK